MSRRNHLGSKSIIHSIPYLSLIGTPKTEDTGLPDFFSIPGAYAAINAYRGNLLPWSPVNAKSFEATIDTLLAQVEEGRYSGAMATLGKTCDLQIERSTGKLKITHKITSSKRPVTRVIEITPEALVGSVQGATYKDPIRVSEVRGTMAAVEIKKDVKAENQVSTHIMFERRTDLDGLVVRLNGSEMYCRRLTKK